MNKTPLVSIVITSFNRLNELKETVEKTTEIPYQNLEIIIVDGGSTDGCVEYIKSIKQDNIKALILGVDKGSAFSHSKGMESAKGEYLITIDDDCYLKPNVVEKMVNIFEKNPKLGAIGFGLINPNKIPPRESYWDQVIVPENNYDNKYETMNYSSASGFRKSILDKLGFMDYDWAWSSRGEDVELMMRIISNGYNTVLIPELVAYHKAAPSNRPSDILTMNGINSTIWIALKYYPSQYAILTIFKIFYYSIYFSFFNKTDIYLKAIYRALKKSGKMIKNKPKIDSTILSKIHLPIIWLFSISSDNKWAGE